MFWLYKKEYVEELENTNNGLILELDELKSKYQDLLYSTCEHPKSFVEHSLEFTAVDNKPIVKSKCLKCNRVIKEENNPNDTDILATLGIGVDIKRGFLKGEAFCIAIDTVKGYNYKVNYLRTYYADYTESIEYYILTANQTILIGKDTGGKIRHKLYTKALDTVIRGGEIKGYGKV